MSGPLVATAEGVWIVAAIALLAGIIGCALAYEVAGMLARRRRIRPDAERDGEPHDWSAL